MTQSYANVHLWGRRIGAVAWNSDRQVAEFEYTGEFLDSGLEPAPFTMPVRPGVFAFPALPRATFHGLPGLLADSLPDRFGSALIDAWLSSRGRDRSGFSPVEQLCYVGSRGMGALEYRPAVRGQNRSAAVHIDELANLAAHVLARRGEMATTLDDQGLADLLRVGTSAGGARAKAVIAWNPANGDVRSGQVPAPSGFEYWLLKFDGVGSGDRGLVDPKGYGRIEYAYHLMARDAGVEMAPARLEVDRAGRAHFMSKRFDRSDGGDKLHMQSLTGLRHFDFNQPGAHSYEEAMASAQGLGIPPAGVDQIFRRMAFNVIARNQDDHTKNIAFLMDRGGQWHLAPAFDVIWAYNPHGDWTSLHQMTINGKRDGFSRQDLIEVGRHFGLRDPGDVIDSVATVVAGWPKYAATADVTDDHRDLIGASHRLHLSGAGMRV